MTLTIMSLDKKSKKELKELCAHFMKMIIIRHKLQKDFIDIFQHIGIFGNYIRVRDLVHYETELAKLNLDELNKLLKNEEEKDK